MFVKTLAQSQLTRRSEAEKAENADEDGYGLRVWHCAGAGYKGCVDVHKLVVYWIGKSQQKHMDLKSETPTRNRSVCSISHLSKKQREKEDRSWQLLSKWNVSENPQSCVGLKSSATARLRWQFVICNMLGYAGGSARVIPPCQTLILCRSLYNLPWLQPWCQRRPSFRQHTFP